MYKSLLPLPSTPLIDPPVHLATHRRLENIKQQNPNFRSAPDFIYKLLQDENISSLPPWRRGRERFWARNRTPPETLRASKRRLSIRDQIANWSFDGAFQWPLKSETCCQSINGRRDLGATLCKSLRILQWSYTERRCIPRRCKTDTSGSDWNNRRHKLDKPRQLIVVLGVEGLLLCRTPSIRQ